MSASPDRLSPERGQPSVKNISKEEGYRLLRSWQSSCTSLGFAYFGSGDGIVQVGTTRVVQAGEKLFLNIGGSHLVVKLEQASFQYRIIEVSAPSAMGSMHLLQGKRAVEGLAVTLGSDNWLFLFPGFDDSILSLAAWTSPKIRVRRPTRE